MIIKTFKLGNTTIEVDDTYFPKTKEENEKVYEQFNKTACKILSMEQNKKGKDK